MSGAAQREVTKKDTALPHGTPDASGNAAIIIIVMSLIIIMISLIRMIIMIIIMVILIFITISSIAIVIPACIGWGCETCKPLYRVTPIMGTVVLSPSWSHG